MNSNRKTALKKLGGNEMTNRIADTSQLQAAKVAGLGLLITLIGVIFTSVAVSYTHLTLPTTPYV